MKKIIGIAAIAILSSFTTNVQDGGKELCKSYFPIQEGTVLSYETYNPKDKLESSNTMEVKKITETATAMTIDVYMKATDKKGKDVYESDFTYSCEGGVFKMSMDNMMDGQSMQSFKDMEMEITQTGLKFPGELFVGQKLEDGEMTMKMVSNGMEMMKFNITNREVLAKETITTPAGTFECFKITSTTKSKVAFMNIESSSVDWIAVNVGNVRSESYNKSGKLTGYTVLSEIKQ